jgi:hypothetical protein
MDLRLDGGCRREQGNCQQRCKTPLDFLHVGKHSGFAPLQICQINVGENFTLSFYSLLTNACQFLT